MRRVDKREMTQLHTDGVVGSTDKAWDIAFGKRKVWLPKSQTEIVDTYEIDVPIWLMEANGLEDFQHKEVKKNGRV